jgi:hypothetical protein
MVSFYRWFDLVRTQKWGEYAATYQIGGTAYGNHTPQTLHEIFNHSIT